MRLSDACTNVQASDSTRNSNWPYRRSRGVGLLKPARQVRSTAHLRRLLVEPLTRTYLVGSERWQPRSYQCFNPDLKTHSTLSADLRIHGVKQCLHSDPKHVVRHKIMSRTSHNREYAQRLGQVYGDDFQEEVIFLLGQTYTAFQRVPQKPGGDGGLDGLTHDYSHGYCIYGLDLQPSSKTSADELRKKIAAKFRSDLRSLFELTHENNVLIYEENKPLAAILTAGKKLKLIRLIANYMEDHRLLGDLNTSFVEYKSASRQKYVESDCSFTLWGPDDICNQLVINDTALFRIREPGIATIIEEVENTAPHELPAPAVAIDSLEDKLKHLSNEAEFITEQKEQILTEWRRHLLLMQKFNTHLPDLHKKLESLVKKVALEATMESAAGKNANIAPELISQMRDRIYQGATSILGQVMPDAVAHEFAEWTVAKLIGHCPLDWRAKKRTA